MFVAVTTAQIVGSLVVVLAGALIAAGIIALVNWRYRDHIFIGQAPGWTPYQDQAAAIGRVTGGKEWRGDPVVAFSPPRGLTPGLVGTLVDGQAELRDVTATILDLARRHHLRLTPLLDEDASKRDGKPHARDLQITLEPTGAVPGELTEWEALLLDSMSSLGSSLTMKDLIRLRGRELRLVQHLLYQSTVEYGWYARHPQHRSGIGVGILWFAGLVLVGSLLAQFTSSVVLMGSIVTGLIVAFGVRVRSPRTAVGTAVRIQALGFKKYLATAEAGQINFEEAAGLFSAYLPYAIVFGVADHWTAVFGQVRARAEAEGALLDYTALDWFSFSTDLGFWLMMDAISDLGFAGMGGLFDGLGEGFGDLDGLTDGSFDFGETDLGQGLEDVGSGVMDFFDSFDF